MAKNDYGLVRILLFDPDLTSRNATKFALAGIGIKNIAEFYTIRGLPDALRETEFELLILECSTGARHLFKLVGDLRKNSLGSNPFVSIIMTVWHPTDELVYQALQSGIDDLVIKPISANSMVGRIDSLIRMRKPFVFEEDYYGPIRKVTSGQVDKRAPVEVPNSLQAKATRTPEKAVTQELVDSIISFQRCKRLQQRMDRSIDGLRDYFANRDARDFPVGLASDLPMIAGELADEAHGGAFLHIVELAKTLKSIGTTLHNDGVRATASDLALLDQTAMAVRLGLKDRDSATEAATAIAETIARAQRGR